VYLHWTAYREYPPCWFAPDRSANPRIPQRLCDEGLPYGWASACQEEAKQLSGSKICRHPRSSLLSAPRLRIDMSSLLALVAQCAGSLTSITRMGGAASVSGECPRDDTVYVVVSAPSNVQERLRSLAAASKRITTGSHWSKQFVVVDMLYSEAKYRDVSSWEDRWARDIQTTVADQQRRHGADKVVALAIFDGATNWLGVPTAKSGACKYERGELSGLLRGTQTRKVHFESALIKNAIILNS